MMPFKYFEEHNPGVLKTVILQEEIADLYSCAQKIRPIDRKTGQVKEGISLEGMTKCVNKLKELEDNKIGYRENLIQLLGYANIHKEPIAVNDPLVVIRNMLKARIHKLDFRGMLEARGNIHQLSKLENLGIGKSVAVVELIVQLKIENKLHDFIAAWKRLNSVAPKSEVLITN